MTGATDDPPPLENEEELLDYIEEQTEELCEIHDHIRRVVKHLEIHEDWFNGYDEPRRAKFDLLPIVKMFIYMHAQDFSQSDLSRRLNEAPVIWITFNLEQALSQPIISHNWRERFDPDERSTIKGIAEVVREICAEHDVIDVNEPPPEVAEVQGTALEDEQIMNAIERATELGFEAFTADRANNITHDLEAYFERQGYLNLSSAGQMTKGRRFKRMSPREKVPQRRGHNDTLRKVADPDSNIEFQDFDPDDPRPAWKRIRDELLEPFHIGVENILDEIVGRDRDGFNEPVHAAIDITTIPFHKWPFRPKRDERPEDYPVEYETRGGKTKQKLLRGDYPTMVSGLQDEEEWGYKIATLSIIAEDTPIILAIEPVRDKRKWESDDLETETRGDTVERLIEQATQHVEIQKLFMDAGFDSMQVRDAADQAGIQYILKTRRDTDVDKAQIKEIEEDDLVDLRVMHGGLNYEDREHELSFIYRKKETERGTKTTLLTTNGHVSSDRAMGLSKQYDQRMEIETALLNPQTAPGLEEMNNPN